MCTALLVRVGVIALQTQEMSLAFSKRGPCGCRRCDNYCNRCGQYPDRYPNPADQRVSTQLDFNPSSTTLAQDNDDARQWCSPIWRGRRQECLTTPAIGRSLASSFTTMMTYRWK